MVDSKKYDGSQWEHSLRKLATATEAIENPLYTDGTAITSYTISGNTVQNGTPTPSNPVEVNGVGVRTENLWSGDIIKELIFDVGYYRNSDVNNNVIYIPVISGNTYTFSISNIVQGTSFTSVCSIDKPAVDGTYIVNGTNTFIRHGEVTTFTRTIPDGANWWAIQIRTLNNLSNNIMINEGSTAKPYEPYGYKIPILSGGVTTNIYLGSTQATRQIKKLVLDGTENWTVSSYPNIFYTVDFTDYLRELDTNLSLCSHYRTIEQVQGASFITNGVMSWYGRTNVSRLYIGDVRFSTAAELQTYLGQQYAAGTPIVVWYVLTTPETATVNEPLMKIGDYADTLSNATAIPTTEGANSITVDTTVQPSEFTATWTGWHDANVKEWDGSDWQ